MKGKRFIQTLLFGICNSILITHARTLTAIPLPFTHDLPSKEITTLYQDREGLIWIGTTWGVARYDGFHTQVFKSDHTQPEKLTDNSITPLTDTENYVFIGTQEGLNIFNKRTWKLTPIQEGIFSKTEIKFLYTDHQENLWIAIHESLYRCDEQLNILMKYDLETGVTSIYEDRKRNLWIMTWGKGFFRWASDKDCLIGYPPVGKANIPFTMFQDREERYWIGSWGDGLFRFYPERHSNRMYEKQNVKGDIFFDLEQDEYSGRLWFLGHPNLQIFEYDDSSGTLSTTTEHVNLDYNRMFSCILKDHENNLWLGAFDSGYYLSFTDRTSLNYSLPYIKDSLGFDPNIHCMYEDEEGIMWLNQERHGLILHDVRSQTRSNLYPEYGNTHTEVNFIAPSAHPRTVYMASSYNPTVFQAKRDEMNIHFTDTLVIAPSGAETGHVIGLKEDKKGYLWTLTEKELYIHNNQKERILQGTELLKNICSITESPDGYIYAGSTTGEIFKILTEKNSVKVLSRYLFPPNMINGHNRIRHIHYDARRYLWIATALGCIYQLDCERKLLINHTQHCMPEVQPILNIFTEKEYLWIVTPNAAIHYIPSNRIRSVYSVPNENQTVHTFRKNAACIGKNGHLYAGGHGGFMLLSPLLDSTSTPNALRLTDVWINGESLCNQPSEAGCIKDSTINLATWITDITLYFSSFVYSQPKQFRLAYRFKGEKQEYTPLGQGQNTIHLENLFPGTHSLQVWQTDNSGNPLGTINTYTLIKQRTWHESPFIYLIYIVLGLLGMSGTGFYLHLRKRSKQMEESNNVSNALENTPPNQEQLFLNEIIAAVEQHLQDSDFTLESLSTEMYMSKSTMNRKIKSITGLTPMDFVKNVRMKKACRLLQSKDMNISEVAFAVGFSDPKYFAKCFKDEYGITPSQYQQKPDKTDQANKKDFRAR